MPPKVPPLQLALRFVLELAAFASLGLFGRSLDAGPLGWLWAVLFPLVAAVMWGTFAVKGDPSRSGKAPLAVRGALRLTLELFVFLGGAAALAATGRYTVAAVFAGLVAVHPALTVPRLRWLLSQ
jgi:hypothetical protein